ncbi:tolloid-like protein 1 [Montipora foliosa]|uniref:tolloid-like protein 1 n=1 Tax=Montipora foliosa TaxID=591990 RepID=UPI0035F1CB50
MIIAGLSMLVFLALISLYQLPLASAYHCLGELSCYECFRPPTGVTLESSFDTTKSISPLYYGPSGVTCLWKIRKPPSLYVDYAIRLTFRSFKIVSSPDCREEYIEIRDGDVFDNSTLIGKFCGTRLPPMVVSPHTFLFVKLNVSFSWLPFDASYKAIIPDCVRPPTGITLESSNNTRKSIIPPSYGTPLKTCLWKFRKPPSFSVDYAVRLTFDSFRPVSSSDCREEYIEIRDGDVFDNSTLIGKFCGTRRPPIVVSSHNYVFVKLSVSISWMPFRAWFRAIITENSPGKCSINSSFLHNNNLQLDSSS